MTGVEIFADPYTYVLFVIGVIGMGFHWLKRFLRKQSSISFKEWLFVHHKRYTIYAFLTYIGVYWALLLSGIDGTDLTSWTTLFLAGYTIDSAVNDDLQKREEVDFEDGFNEPPV